MSAREEIVLKAEAWRPLPGAEGRYEVSDMGRVRSLLYRTRARETPLMLRLRPNIHGYLGICIPRFGQRGKSVNVHRLVLEAFVGPRPAGMQAAHENGIRTDNRLTNLSWKTPRENHADKRRHGTQFQGESSPNARLTAPDVYAIRAARAAGERRSVLAHRYGVSERAIYDIATRRRWRCLS